jgi:hypothetical protein
MLVYAPGQFFLPHRDSEKSDNMVGALVVTLPSSFKGGAMLVEHQGKTATYRGSKKFLSFLAFYADCQHEVRPVKEGYRVVLTYNLMLDDGAAVQCVPNPEPPSVTADRLAEALREHFETPLPPRRSWDQDAPPSDPPKRLAVLLDHQYTERGLGWQRLKGADTTRVAVLRSAAEGYGCEMVLALVEVQERWSCLESDEGGYWHRQSRHQRYRSWERDEDDEWSEDNPADDGPDSYELQDLIESKITLTHWIDSVGEPGTSIITHVADEEVCFTTPSSSLEAHTTEYEGYMGNYGNTMDRWYHRAAIVLWPQQHAFARRAEASPAWAMTTLSQRLQSGQLSEARELAASLLPFWTDTAPHEAQRGFFDQTLRVAEGLKSSELAASLLQPFRLEALTPGRASVFVALVKLYGEPWTRSLLSAWTAHLWHPDKLDPLTWLGSLPRLCAAICKVDTEGQQCAKLIWKNRWVWSKEKIEEGVSSKSPSQRDEAVKGLAKPIAGILESAEICGAEELQDEAVAFFCTTENQPLIPSLVRVLRAITPKASPKKQLAPTLVAIRRYCVQQLEERLAVPAREKDDWSIDLPTDCPCDLCEILGEFLADRTQQQLEWPIAKQKRMHIHQQLDWYELPVRHTTQRSGSPYTLVLIKTTDLLKSETKARRSWQADLDWLTKSSTSE